MMVASELLDTNMVASELLDSGWKIRKFGRYIFVSLNNRKVSQMEVQYELDRIFEGIEFDLQSTENGVLVTV